MCCASLHRTGTFCFVWRKYCLRPTLKANRDANLANKWMDVIREAIKCDLPVVTVTTPPKQKGLRLFGRKKRVQAPTPSPAVVPEDRRVNTFQPGQKPAASATTPRQAATIQPMMRTKEEPQVTPKTEDITSSPKPQEAQTALTTSSPGQAAQPQRVRRAVLTRAVCLSALIFLFSCFLHLINTV